MNIREKECLLHLGCETAHAGTQSQRSQSSALLLVLPAAVRLVRGGGCHISGGFLFSPRPSGTDRAGPLGVGMGAFGLVVYSKGYQHHKDNRLVMLAGWRMASPPPPPYPLIVGAVHWGGQGHWLRVLTDPGQMLALHSPYTGHRTS